MAKGKESALIRTSWLSIFEELDDAEAGQLIKHYMRFINGLEPVPPNRLIKLVFEPIKIQLEKDLDAWKLTCEKNKVNGEKGGRPTKINEGKEPTGLIGFPKKPKKAEYDNDKIKEDERIRLEEERKKKEEEEKKRLLLVKREKAVALALERKKAFYKSLIPFLALYEKEMIKEFYDYWSEFDKPQTKMKWEFNKTFEIAKRLATWKKNAKSNKAYQSEGDKRRDAAENLGKMSQAVVQNTIVDLTKINKTDEH